MEMFTQAHADLLTPLTVDQLEKHIDYWRMGRWSITFSFALQVFRVLFFLEIQGKLLFQKSES